MEIKLRRKYLSASRGRYKSKHNQQGTHDRNKIGYQAHVKKFGVPRQKAMLVDALRGTHRMVYYDDYERQRGRGT